MRAATRPGFTYRGRHHQPVLAQFRPTWRQAVAGGLLIGSLTSLVVAMGVLGWRLAGTPGLLEALAAAVPGPVPPGLLGWLVVLAPLPAGLAVSVAVRHSTGVHLDSTGIRSWPGGDVNWQRVLDIRAERRRGRTVLAVYRDDGTVLRLAAPYDGWLLDGDPRFEQKLFVIRNLWDTHRHRCPPR